MLNQRSSSSNPLIGLIMMILTGVVIYFIIKGIWKLLMFLAPVIVIATLFINHNVYINYGKNIVRAFNSHWAMGAIYTLFTVAFFPFVIFYLFAKSLVLRKFSNKRAEQMWQNKKRAEEEYVEFEEVDIDIEEEIKPIELPPLEPKANKKDPNNPYDNYFN